MADIYNIGDKRKILKHSTIVSEIKYIGWYQIGGTIGLSIFFVQKPSWWHRFWMKKLLGWKWNDT